MEILLHGMNSKKQIQKKESKGYTIIFPKTGKAVKELQNLFRRREKQVEKAIEKLKENPTNFRVKGIEKINNHAFGDYTIRVSKGDRLFYDVDEKNKKVFILRAGKHDLYRLG